MAADTNIAEIALNNLLTQYRESPKLIDEIKSQIRQVQEVYDAIACIPESFNLNTAVDDQLTIIGKRLGFTRTHCVCTSQPFYGFDCGDNVQSVASFCDDNATWANCGTQGLGSITINDNETYRKLLKARSIQVNNNFDIESLCDAVHFLWGDQATVLGSSNNTVTIGIGRDLTVQEIALLQIYPRVLPVALGINIRFHFGSFDNLFGFGEGWAGFCNVSDEESIRIIDQNGNQVTDQDGNFLITETSISTDSGNPSWVCQIDVQPYGCSDGVI